MATSNMTMDQIFQAARRLPESKRRVLLKRLEELPQEDAVLAAANQLRSRYRLAPKQRKRLGVLSAKGKDGTLSTAEWRELAHLVDEMRGNWVEFAKAVVDEVKKPSRRRKTNQLASG